VEVRGKTLDEVEAIVAGVKVLQARGQEKMTAAEAIAAAPEMPGQGKRTDLEPLSNGQKLPSQGGQSKARLAARLKRDHPEIADRVQAGEFKSIRAAAIAAGMP
jgi:hypothetical protein